MPEIPELEAIRSFLADRLPGRRVEAAEPRIPPVFRTPTAELRERLPGDVFGVPLRHGKYLLLPFASGMVLAINPMLTGRFQYLPASEPLAKRTCLRVGIEGGNDLRYVDERVMGKLYFLPAESLARIPGWSDAGPDFLDPALDEEAWLERVRRFRGAIKAVLTNAKFVQGIGNAYADEILWEAGVNPFTPRTALSDAQLRAIFRAGRAVMAWAEPLAAAAMIRGDRLDYDERREFLRVHRRGGQPCPRCGTPISEITAGGRVTSFCRACQPGGPLIGRGRPGA
ncbi:Formamidopyrimidine-DNA glycosylase [bacterium HR29]|jgi:formamidopyrimidine-DNA glycosylase|nr:Formamidopyrimidine-DNA glycosylase [bacterium HR29]